MTHDFTISSGVGGRRVVIDGIDVSDVVHGVEVSMPDGAVPTVVLNVTVPGVLAGAGVVVENYRGPSAGDLLNQVTGEQLSTGVLQVMEEGGVETFGDAAILWLRRQLAAEEIDPAPIFDADL